MGRETRLSRLCGWSVRVVPGIFALAFCASAFADDPSKNVVALPSQPLPANTTKKICYVVAGGCVLPARQRGGKILFFLPPAHHCRFSLNRAAKSKASSRKRLRSRLGGPAR